MAQNIESSEFWKSKLNSFNNNFISNICRLCANLCDNSVPIFDKINHKGSIYSKLKKCFPSISVLENDHKPKQICSMCVSKLDICFSFIEMSLESDTKFEMALQNRSVPQIQIMNDLSWSQIKQEPIWNFAKPSTVTMTKPDQKLLQVSAAELSNQTFQQKSYQQMVQVPVSTSDPYTSYTLQNGSNLGLIFGKQDFNHNILPNVPGTDGLSPQDLIFLVDLKKDNCTISPSKKTEVTGPSVANKAAGLNSYQTKILTGQELRTSNGSNFDDKFNLHQSAKVTSSFVNGSTCTASLLKALESDVINGVIKLENLNGESVTLHQPLKTNLSTNFENIPAASTSNVESVKKCSTQPTTRDFECTICNKVFSRRNRLNAHLARHSSIRPHPCDKCDQRFITRWDLTLHLRIHSGIFSCEFCGKAFPAKGKLERHRRTHTGERPFPCDQCNKAFSEKRNLENHLKTHAATEVHQATNIHILCQTCGRNIINSDGSTMKSKCEICEKKSIFDSFVDSNRNLLTQCTASKCLSTQLNSHSNSSIASNTASNF